MDSVVGSLERVRGDVVKCKEWSDLKQRLETQLEELYFQKPFIRLSNREKLAAVSQATRQLQKAGVLDDTRAVVSKSLEKEFGPFHSSKQDHHGGHDQTDSDSIATACTHLLKENAHLKHYLKNFFNRPLPQKLRSVAWKVLLHHSAARNEFNVVRESSNDFQEQTAEQKRIGHRCETLLISNPIYHDLADSISVLKAMKTVVLYWHQKEKNRVPDTDILVCLPFLYAWRKELQQHPIQTDGTNWDLISEISQQYVSFMEMLPLTMHSVIMDQALEAMTKFSEQVEELLSCQDQKLYEDLKKILSAQRVSHSSSAVSQEEQLPFHKRLRNILHPHHPHMQKLLVGDLSMEVLCYIWDQCFIGLDNPGYQCLPYYVTVWLILLREKLMKCRSGNGVAEVLDTQSANLTVAQFQNEIDMRFRQALSSQLGISSQRLPNANEQQEKQQQWQPLQNEHVSTSKHPSIASQLQMPVSTSAQSAIRGLEPFAGERGFSAAMSQMQDDPEKEYLKKKVSFLQKQLEEEQKSLHDKEKNAHKKEMEALLNEIEVLKKRVSDSVEHSQSTNTAASSVGISTIPTNVTMLSPPGSIAFMGSPFMMPQSSLVQSLPTQISSSSHHTALHSQLTNKDAQDIWCKIFERFTTAAYTVCHGSDQDKKDLVSTLLKRSHLEDT